MHVPLEDLARRDTLRTRLRYFLTPIDGRYEDLPGEHWYLRVLRDFTAGLIVAMVAIPLAMGFAMASGLRPEQGIVGGAVAGLVGALFGGSKYQVYGPTAAFIPIIAAIMLAHDHAFLVLVSLLAGLVLVTLGLVRFGRVVNMVPHSIVVGFTIGIAGTIALSQIGEVLGIDRKLGTSFFDKVTGIAQSVDQISLWAVALAAFVFVATKVLLKASIYIPAPLIAIGAATAVAATLLADKGLALVRTRYGSIPTDFWVVTPPDLSTLWNPALGPEIAYYVTAIVFVAAIESLLCSRMADRLAGNKGRPFDPDKELFGQGLVQVAVPLLNGFPHTGALARTATNIKLGAVSPLAGIFKCFLKLALAAYLATWLEAVPMACIGGILLYVAFNMVKGDEVREVVRDGRFHIGLMIYTAVAVLVTDFLTGVLTALVIYGVRRLTEVRVSIAEGDGRVDVRIDGALTFVAAARLPERLQAIPRGSQVYVDLNVDVMDRSGWKALHGFCQRFMEDGGRVHIEGLHEAWSAGGSDARRSPGGHASADGDGPTEPDSPADADAGALEADAPALEPDTVGSSRGR